MQQTPPIAQTPTQRLAERCLGEGDGPLEKFVRSRRPGRPWRLIARDLLEATNGAVDVTPEMIRRWFPDRAGRAS